jgi:hypothetical protein
LFIASFVKGNNSSAYKNNLCLLINFNHYQHGLYHQVRPPVKNLRTGWNSMYCKMV